MSVSLRTPSTSGPVVNMGPRRLADRTWDVKAGSISGRAGGGGGERGTAAMVAEGIRAAAMCVGD